MRNPLSFDAKYIYSNNVKVAQINHDNKSVKMLSYFSYDIQQYVRDIANGLNGKCYNFIN